MNGWKQDDDGSYFHVNEIIKDVRDFNDRVGNREIGVGTILNQLSIAKYEIEQLKLENVQLKLKLLEKLLENEEKN